MIRAAAPVAFAVGLLACALVAGCAAPGEPVPRHPIVPTPITDLAARQSGNSFDLRFSLPTHSTDREPLSERPSIEIYRVKLPPGAVADKKAPWRLAYTIPSEEVDRYQKNDRVEFHDPLTPDDFAGAGGSKFAYKVRTREVKAQASADSNVITVRAYPPPDAPRDVKADVEENAIEISWAAPATAQNANPAFSYRVYREELESAPVDASNAERPAVKAPFALLSETAETRFEDRGFELGRTYVYSIRSVAVYNGESVESDQPQSSMATVTARDVFPPAPPADLEAATIPATGQTAPYVELSWSISTETDLAGYYVYRSEEESLPGDRVTTELLPTPAFRDMSVAPGRRYFYRVSAVDRAGNEGSKSSAAVVDVP